MHSLESAPPQQHLIQYSYQKHDVDDLTAITKLIHRRKLVVVKARIVEILCSYRPMLMYFATFAVAAITVIISLIIFTITAVP